MKIREISLDQIKAGINWKIEDSREFTEKDLEDLTIVLCTDFSDGDYVVYSSVFVNDLGDVTPTVLIKAAGDPEYGGDMCEMIDGNWRRVGANPDPDSLLFGNSYIGNPLGTDPSFDTGDTNDDERAYNREEFRKWVDRI